MKPIIREARFVFAESETKVACRVEYTGPALGASSTWRSKSFPPHNTMQEIFMSMGSVLEWAICERPE